MWRNAYTTCHESLSCRLYSGYSLSAIVAKYKDSLSRVKIVSSLHWLFFECECSEMKRRPVMSHYRVVFALAILRVRMKCGILAHLMFTRAQKMHPLPLWIGEKYSQTIPCIFMVATFDRHVLHL
jgi:hypothetical protein